MKLKRIVIQSQIEIDKFLSEHEIYSVNTLKRTIKNDNYYISLSEEVSYWEIFYHADAPARIGEDGKKN